MTPSHWPALANIGSVMFIPAPVSKTTKDQTGPEAFPCARDDQGEHAHPLTTVKWSYVRPVARQLHIGSSKRGFSKGRGYASGLFMDLPPAPTSRTLGCRICPPTRHPGLQPNPTRNYQDIECDHMVGIPPSTPL